VRIKINGVLRINVILLALLAFSIIVFLSPKQVASEFHTNERFRCKVVWVGSRPQILGTKELIYTRNLAKDIVLSDPKIQEIIRDRTYSIQVSVYHECKILDINREGDLIIMTLQADPALRALVVIEFPDGSGYYIHVNLSNKEIENIRYSQNIPP